MSRRDLEVAAKPLLFRLYQLVEDGVTDLDDMPKERLVGLKPVRDRAKAALDQTHAGGRPPANIAPELIEELGGMMMRRNICEGRIPFRKAWLRSTVDRIDVDAETARIIGDKANLEQTIAAANAGTLKEPDVRSSIRKWCAVQDRTADTYTLEISMQFQQRL